MPGPVKNAEGLIEKAGDMVVYVAGFPAIYGVQPLFFKDPIFKARAAISAPKFSDTLISIERKETKESDIKL
jgi:type IV secretion system protein VirD4